MIGSSIPIVVKAVGRIFVTAVHIGGVLQLIVRSVGSWPVVMDVDNCGVVMIWVVLVLVRRMRVAMIMVNVVWLIAMVVNNMLVAEITVVTMVGVEVISWLLELMLVIISGIIGMRSDIDNIT